jgi:type I restriction enzyme S subunit
LQSVEIPLPPLALQREFAAFIAQQEKARASLKESLAALSAAQKSLMNQVFKGD